MPSSVTRLPNTYFKDRPGLPANRVASMSTASPQLPRGKCRSEIGLASGGTDMIWVRSDSATLRMVCSWSDCVNVASGGPADDSAPLLRRVRGDRATLLHQ